MSEGQLLLVPGVSDESSRLISSFVSFFFFFLLLFGNLYSKVPHPHQRRPAFILSGLRKESGMSRSPMIFSEEQSPHGAGTSQSVKIPTGISISIKSSDSFFFSGN